MSLIYNLLMVLPPLKRGTEPVPVSGVSGCTSGVGHSGHTHLRISPGQGASSTQMKFCWSC